MTHPHPHPHPRPHDRNSACCGARACCGGGPGDTDPTPPQEPYPDFPRAGGNGS